MVVVMSYQVVSISSRKIRDKNKKRKKMTGFLSLVTRLVSARERGKAVLGSIGDRRACIDGMLVCMRVREGRVIVYWRCEGVRIREDFGCREVGCVYVGVW